VGGASRALPEAGLLRAAEREEAVAYLARDARANLTLLDLVDRVGVPPLPEETPAQVSAVRVEGHIAGLAALRPTVVLDAGLTPNLLEALLPDIEAFGVGLIKSRASLVDLLWAELASRGMRQRPLIDRRELAYCVRRGDLVDGSSSLRAEVRAARSDDIEVLVHAASESLLAEGRPDPARQDPRGFRRWVAGRIGRARVAVHAGRVVFVGYADIRRREGWLVQGVYTWPDARRRGFARAGMLALCREAFEHGAEHVQLAVIEGNEAARRLYEGMGFRAFEPLRTILLS
jgi:ribosomal protein S18 acetylase RimI-like enzyme